MRWVLTGPGPKELRFEGPQGRQVTVRAQVVVNCAGLHAQQVAGCLRGMPAQHVPPRHLARGCYFTLKGALLAVFCSQPAPHLLLHLQVTRQMLWSSGRGAAASACSIRPASTVAEA